jgi:hypothetical protein
VGYVASDKVNLTIGVNNGWNNDSSVPNGGKTAEIAASLTPNKSLSFSVAAYYGSFDLGAGLAGNRALVDAVGTWTATPSLTVVLNVDWDQQEHPAGPGTGTASWYGVAAYVNYAINDRWRLSVRSEYLDDEDGFLFGTSTKVNETTLTFGYLPAKAFELRLEARYGSYIPIAGGSNDATQGWLQALYKF